MDKIYHQLNGRVLNEYIYAKYRTIDVGQTVLPNFMNQQVDWIMKWILKLAINKFLLKSKYDWMEPETLLYIYIYNRQQYILAENYLQWYKHNK